MSCRAPNRPFKCFNRQCSLRTRARPQVLTVKAREPKQGKTEEIPTPEVFVVASYEADYKPIFRLPPTYLRGECPSDATIRVA